MSGPRASARAAAGALGVASRRHRRDHDDPVPWWRSLESTVLTGVTGTTLMAIGGAVAGASGPSDDSRFFWAVPAVPVSPSTHPIAALACFYAGLLLVTRGWLGLRRVARRGAIGSRGVVAVAILWSIPLLLGPPIGSRDVYSYVALGGVADAGQDPYAVGPAAVEGVSVDAVDPVWRDQPAPYGPIFVAVARASVNIANVSVDTDVRWAVYALRAVALTGLALVAVGVVAIARRAGRDPADALVLVLANPLSLLHLVSGAHNEALMIGLLTAGVAAAGTAIDRGRAPIVGVVLVSLGAAVKVPALLGAAYIAYSWAARSATLTQRLGRVALCAGVALSTLTVTSAWTGYGWGWIEVLSGAGSVRAYLSISTIVGFVAHHAGVAIGLSPDLDSVIDVAQDVGLVVGVLAAVVLLRRSGHLGPVALGAGLVALALLGPSVQPWYLLWGAAIWAAVRSGEANRLLVMLSVVLSFGVLPMGPDLGRLALDHRATLLLALVVLVPLTLPLPRVKRPVTAGPPARARSEGTTVVVPTKEERDNVAELIRRLRAVLDERRDAIVIVDDSDDDTAEVARHAASGDGVPVTVVHRAGRDRRGGLGGAVVDGFCAARTRRAVVIDGDLQHPPELVPDLVDALVGGADVAVGSRFAPGGDHGLSGLRATVSKVSGTLARWTFPERVGQVRDPMSGCFAIDLDVVVVQRLRPNGFKILLELLATHRLSATEVPLRFGQRVAGRSKATLAEGVRFAAQLVDLRLAALGPWSVEPTATVTSPGLVGAAPDPVRPPRPPRLAAQAHSGRPESSGGAA